MTAVCTAHLGPLTCVRVETHQPHHGCVYVSTSGVPDCPKEEMA